MIRYIRSIDRTAAYHLTLAHELRRTRQVAIGHFVPWERIPTVGLSSLEVSDAVGDDGVRLYTTKLTALLPCAIVPPSEPTAYRLTLTDGTQLLLGTSHRPHPVQTQTDTHPDRAAEWCACTLTVTWTADVGALEIISLKS